MHLFFDKAACQNTRRALQNEWLLTNGLGDYASSSILNCNTRKYHGLLVSSTPHGRMVLLSALEESLQGENREFLFSTRQHPLTMYPNGYEFQELFSLEDWPVFVYRMGKTFIRRELLLERGKTRLLVRWTIDGNGLMPTKLRVKPLLAVRGFHELTSANDAISSNCTPIPGGFAITPYPGQPTLYFQNIDQNGFTEAPDWYRNIEYQSEHERGFPYSEDLFMPGCIDFSVAGRSTVFLTVGTSPLECAPEEIWEREVRFYQERRQQEGRAGLIKHLKRSGEQFIVRDPQGRMAVLAGYHWFDAWGRDTLISLPGLTFAAGRIAQGCEILAEIGKSVRNGLVPNMFSPDGNDAYNSADAALWYAFAVQSFLAADGSDEAYAWVKAHAWTPLLEIVKGFRRGPGFDIYIDQEGLLHASNATTQLTWMDAQVHGHPVTPRHGCAVELNALWYNTLAFIQELAEKFGESEVNEQAQLKELRKHFIRHFYITTPDGGYLGDVWRDGWLDRSIRPNQIFAVSLPHSPVPEKFQYSIWHTVKENLLTPYGLRTLAPSDLAFQSRYEGGPEQRDASYHQGTVWPWLLGHYTDATVRATWAVEQEMHELLETVSPLFSDHFLQAGLGTFSEVFDAAPPYRPNGCIAQARSVAECLRMLICARRHAPGVYANFREKTFKKLFHPTDDTVGRGRLVETFG